MIDSDNPSGLFSECVKLAISRTAVRVLYVREAVLWILHTLMLLCIFLVLHSFISVITFATITLILIITLILTVIITFLNSVELTRLIHLFSWMLSLRLGIT